MGYPCWPTRELSSDKTHPTARNWGNPRIFIFNINQLIYSYYLGENLYKFVPQFGNVRKSVLGHSMNKVLSPFCFEKAGQMYPVCEMMVVHPLFPFAEAVHLVVEWWAVSVPSSVDFKY